MPAFDQTRTVGLVTLSGAFMGVLLAAAARAGRRGTAAGLMGLRAVETVAVLMTVELVVHNATQATPTTVD